MRRLLAALVVALASCNGATQDDPREPNATRLPDLTATCDAAHDAAGPSCVPRFDRCGENEIPKLGGGCQAVGVPKGGCGEGFVEDGAAGCRPVLPIASCAAGEIALPGDSACSAIATCGSGTWGAIPRDGATLHVDGAFTGSASDGSEGKPFVRIADALAAAKDGATIAIAAGTYEEDLVVDRKVTLHGRCPSMVTVRGMVETKSAAAIEVRADATLRGLTITGKQRGVLVDGASARLEDLHVRDTGDLGVGARDKLGPVALTLRRVLVERARYGGVIGNGARLDLERVVVRDVSFDAEGKTAVGVSVSGSPSTKALGEGRLHRVFVERTAASGISVAGAKATITSSYVRAIARAAELRGGFAVSTAERIPGFPSEIAVVDSVLEETEGGGCFVAGGALRVERTTIRRVGGVGIMLADPNATPAIPLSVEASLVDQATEHGIATRDASAQIERTIVRGTRVARDLGVGVTSVHATAGTKSPKLVLRDLLLARNGIGGLALRGGTLELRGALLAENGAIAVSLEGSKAILERVAVRDTKLDPKTARGFGLLAVRGGDLSVSDLAVEGAHGAGVAVIGSTATIDRVVVRDVLAAPRPDAAGTGILVAASRVAPLDASLVLRDALVERVEGVGMVVEIAKMVLERASVRDVRAAKGRFGDGLTIVAGVHPATGKVVASDASLARLLVERSARAGLAVFGSVAVLRDARLWCNAIDIDVEDRFDDALPTTLAPVLRDVERNECGCGEVFGRCRALSSGILPSRSPS